MSDKDNHSESITHDEGLGIEQEPAFGLAKERDRGATCTQR